MSCGLMTGAARGSLNDEKQFRAPHLAETIVKFTISVFASRLCNARIGPSSRKPAANLILRLSRLDPWTPGPAAPSPLQRGLQPQGELHTAAGQPQAPATLALGRLLRYDGAPASRRPRCRSAKRSTRRCALGPAQRRPQLPSGQHSGLRAAPSRCCAQGRAARAGEGSPAIRARARSRTPRGSRPPRGPKLTRAPRQQKLHKSLSTHPEGRPATAMSRPRPTLLAVCVAAAALLLAP